MGSAALEAWRKRQKAAKAERNSQTGMTEGQSQESTDRRTAGLRPWRAGESGNPAGRRPIPPEVIEILKAASPHAARRLVEMMDDADPKVRLQAIDMAYNRLYGRPVQAVDAQVTTTNVQQAHLQILLELQQKRESVLIEGRAENPIEIEAESSTISEAHFSVDDVQKS